MNTRKLRIIIPLAILVAAGIGFALHVTTGTLSAIGWESVSVLCPLGALTTMLASKTIIPRAVISLALVAVAIIVFGRAFCGWICPVPVIGKFRNAFKKGGNPPKAEDAHGTEAEKTGDLTAAREHVGDTSPAAPCQTDDVTCGPSRSRHLILGTSLISAAIFGFPVFCLICPIGLTFALVFAFILLFGAGDVSWSVVAIPAVLLIEVVFFRKWCSHLCPLSALMSIVGKANRTFRPSVDNSKCLETSRGIACGRCARACSEAVNPRHPECGASASECTRCRACADICPGKAISFPFIPHAEAKTTTPPDAGDSSSRIAHDVDPNA